MIQGGIEGGLDDAFRFGDARLSPLDSRLRENDGSYAKVSRKQKGSSIGPSGWMHNEQLNGRLLRHPLNIQCRPHEDLRPDRQTGFVEIELGVVVSFRTFFGRA